MLFVVKSHLILSPTSERTHEIVILFQRSIKRFKTGELNSVPISKTMRKMLQVKFN